MSDLKFRAWDKTKKEMIFFEGIFNKRPYTEKSTFVQYESSPEYHELEVMRYTELLDKYDSEICEGDLIKNNRGRTCAVVYHRYTASFDTEFVSDAERNISAPHLGFTTSFWKDCVEVIGNIHENPELLESK